MRIKICRPWLCVRGGAERVVLEIARRLAPKHDVEFVLNYYEPKSTYGEFKEFDIKVAKPILPYRWKLSRALGSARYFYDRKLECDAIIADLSPAHWLANRNDNVVFYCHSPLRDAYDLYDEHVRERPFYLRGFYRFAAGVYRHYDGKIVPRILHICTNSKISERRIEKYYNRTAQIIHPGVNPKEFHSGDYGKYFMWVGRFMTHKRPQLAVDAIGKFSKRNPDFYLRMVGGEVEGGASIRPNAHTKVSYHASDKELKELYANCLGFLYTSVDEEWSITSLEAMASGKPVIAVNEGCSRELVRDKVNGLLCEPNAESMSKAMQWLASHPDEAERMGKNARRIVEKEYTWKIFCDEFERMLGRVLKPAI